MITSPNAWDKVAAVSAIATSGVSIAFVILLAAVVFYKVYTMRRGRGESPAEEGSDTPRVEDEDPQMVF